MAMITDQKQIISYWEQFTYRLYYCLSNSGPCNVDLYVIIVV